jgi:hypothetical protein
VNRFEEYNQAGQTTEEWQHREEAAERESAAAELRHHRRSADPDAAAHNRLPVVELQPHPQPTVPAPPKGGATAHQLKSNLLGMHATADMYQRAGRGADLRRQVAKIQEREAELKAASPEIWPLYERDREAERQARRCAAVAAEPGPQPAPPPPPARPAPAEPPARPDTRTTLDCAVETLVAEYTCGAVIDAAWAAAHRLFRPNREKAA